MITNDIMCSNYIRNYACFFAEEYNEKLVERIIDSYNSEIITEENYMTENFADTYFAREDCAKIGFIRENIEQKFKSGEINFREKALLITSLLYGMD